MVRQWSNPPEESSSLHSFRMASRKSGENSVALEKIFDLCGWEPLHQTSSVRAEDFLDRKAAAPPNRGAASLLFEHAVCNVHFVSAAVAVKRQRRRPSLSGSELRPVVVRLRCRA